MEPLATATSLTAYTGGRIDGTDPRVTPVLDGVSAAVRNWCGWHVFPDLQQTVTLDGPGGRYLALPTRHVATVTAVTENGTTLVDGVDYRWSTDGSIKRVTRYWTDDYRAITVTYTHGFEDVPDVTAVVLSVAARLLASPMGAVSESAGGVTVKWSETTRGVAGGLGILDHEYALLAPYRIESI
jgi:hypothetical protein